MVTVKGVVHQVIGHQGGFVLVNCWDEKGKPRQFGLLCGEGGVTADGRVVTGPELVNWYLGLDQRARVEIELETDEDFRASKKAALAIT